MLNWKLAWQKFHDNLNVTCKFYASWGEKLVTRIWNFLLTRNAPEDFDHVFATHEIIYQKTPDAKYYLSEILKSKMSRTTCHVIKKTPPRAAIILRLVFNFRDSICGLSIALGCGFSELILELLQLLQYFAQMLIHFDLCSLGLTSMLASIFVWKFNSRFQRWIFNRWKYLSKAKTYRS